MEKLIIKLYTINKLSLRGVGSVVNKNHHFIKRVLIKNNIKIEKGRIKPITEEHKKSISKSCIGRIGWNKGLKSSKESLYKNMVSHLRFDVSLDWMKQFEDVEKLKCLNSAISSKGGRYNESDSWYKEYIETFYNDKGFNTVYQKWILDKTKYKKPSLDHINPKCNGGINTLNNLQFLSWFENRCKNDMSQLEWNKLKTNITDYFI
jgi:hypothetical protein